MMIPFLIIAIIVGIIAPIWLSYKFRMSIPNPIPAKDIEANKAMDEIWEVVTTFNDGTVILGCVTGDPYYGVPAERQAKGKAQTIATEGVWQDLVLIPPGAIKNITIRCVGQQGLTKEKI